MVHWDVDIGMLPLDIDRPPVRTPPVSMRSATCFWVKPVDCAPGSSPSGEEGNRLLDARALVSLWIERTRDPRDDARRPAKTRLPPELAARAAARAGSAARSVRSSALAPPRPIRWVLRHAPAVAGLLENDFMLLHGCGGRRRAGPL